ncbi:MAG: peptidoglycan D,D-transpeptidase FtsI family protein [Alphaproteobacteria bacterium]
MRLWPFAEAADAARAPLPEVVSGDGFLRGQMDGRMKAAIETGRNRLVLGGVLFVLAFGAIGFRLVELAMQRPAEAATPMASAINERMAVKRADIVDRNGVLMATSLTTPSLYANPREVRRVFEPAEAARRIVKLLPELNESEVKARLELDRAFIWLRRGLTPNQQITINNAGIPGLYFQREERRIYPQGATAAHILGFTGTDNEGLTGVERYQDELLINARQPLRLSLDTRVQHILREEILRSMAKFSAVGGAGMILDVRNGETLAMVSLPDFDLNSRSGTAEDAMFNRNTLGVYEMGSTFKLFTAAMALDAGTATLKSGYDATHPIRVGRFTISDFHGKSRWLSVPEIMVYSSNIGSVKMALDAGTERQRAFLQRIGMLNAPSLELPEVGAPLVPSPWREINTMTIAFGHGLSVSPLQLANGVAALVNGGTLHAATLLRRPNDAPPEGRRVISERTSAQMRGLMRQIVENGTGRNADSVGYPVGGKTGTAEKVGGRGYKRKSLISSFVGAFPIDDPKFVILVMLDEPKGTRETFGYATGGWVAAPVVRAVVNQAGPLLGLAPKQEPQQDRRIVEASASARATATQ